MSQFGFEQIKTWTLQNLPALAVLYQNKYVGMVYDRFASLTSRRQRQVIYGVIGGVSGAIFLSVLVAYLGLWSMRERQRDYFGMVKMLREHQIDQGQQSSEIQVLERNNRLAASGQFKSHLQDLAKFAAISPRMVQVEEMPFSNEGGELRLRQATVQLEKVNLRQLKTYVQAIEGGDYRISVSSLRVLNDDKLRGYMNASLSVVAYIFSPSQEGI